LRRISLTPIALIAIVAASVGVGVGTIWIVRSDDAPANTPFAFSPCEKTAVGELGWNATFATTDAYGRFAETVDTQGRPFGVAPLAVYSDYFRDLYPKLTGASRYQNPEPAQTAIEVLSACPSATADATDPFLFGEEPSAAEQTTIFCVSKAVFDTEVQYGLGSVGYSKTFKDWAESRTPRDESTDYVSEEVAYADITGRSPLVNQEANEAFRVTARACPTPPS